MSGQPGPAMSHEENAIYTLQLASIELDKAIHAGKRGHYPDSRGFANEVAELMESAVRYYKKAGVRWDTD